MSATTPRKRSGLRKAPRGPRIDYRPSPEALQILKSVADELRVSRNVALDRIVRASSASVVGQFEIAAAARFFEPQAARTSSG